MTETELRELDRRIASKLFCSRCVLPFSSSWDAMRRVVEEMRRRGWGYNLMRRKTGRAEAVFATDDDVASATGEDTPEAVAKAALKAVEVRDD